MRNDRGAPVNDLKTDFILANPPFNVSDSRDGCLRDEKRWQYGGRLATHRSICP